MRSLVASIRQRQAEGRLPVLSEIKVRSPKEGDLLRGRDPVQLAQIMNACPIAGLSVVTESHDFGGDLRLIEQVRPQVTLPILCKDFHRQPADLAAAATAGADAVLLIVSMLTHSQLAELQQAAHQLGLETVVEIHTLGDLQRLTQLGLVPDILGVNNRDILVGETDDGDISLTERLAHHFPPDLLVLSESSIRGPMDAQRARQAGADAVLVGTAILTAADTRQAIAELVAVGWP